MMEKRMKKNNKGFSLVELIVVVLIMGIIAVALAPQVMKWVAASRESADAQTKDSLESAIQLAYVKKEVMTEINGSIADPITILCDNTGTTISRTNSKTFTDFEGELTTLLGLTFDSHKSTDVKTKKADRTITIVITGDGTNISFTTTLNDDIETADD